jgi:hypothetical protein
MSQQKIHIPRSIEEATRELNGLGALLTAKNWARAAIVYAFTREGVNQHVGIPTGTLTISDFAKLGIVGLSQREDVGYYRAAWQTAIDDSQAQPVEPGQNVTLPDRAWPPSPRARDAKDVIRSTVRNHPEKIAEVLAEAEMAEPVAELLADQPGFQFGALLNEKRRTRDETVRESLSEPHREIDYSADLRAGVNRLMPVLHAMRDSKWHPDVMEQTLITFLAQLFSEIADGNATTTDLFDEIGAFLGAART